MGFFEFFFSSFGIFGIVFILIFFVFILIFFIVLAINIRRLLGGYTGRRICPTCGLELHSYKRNCPSCGRNFR